MDCSIVIVNYNTSQLICDLLRSLKRYCKKYSYEIIVVDNASPNDDLRKLKIEFPEVQVIFNQSNDGFGIANNLGIKNANGDHILLLNSDTYLESNAIDRCIDFMKSDFVNKQNIGLMACKLLNPDGTYQHSTFGKFNLLKYLINSNAVLSRLAKNKKREEVRSKFVEAVSGAFMLFKKEVFEVVKPFDPDIFMYSEETELCRERVSNYFKIYYWTEVSVVHIGGGSTNKKMLLQEKVSYSLTWYKKGYGLYILHVLWTILNGFTELIVFGFMTRDNRQSSLISLGILPLHIKYQVFIIPRGKNVWGGRTSPLKVIK